MSIQLVESVSTWSYRWLWFGRKFIYVVLGQWLNQSFNALVNYTNRNAKSETTSKQMLVAYVGATGGAVTAAAGMNAMVKVSG